MRTRNRYQPAWTWLPVRVVRWRSASHAYGGTARLGWRLYLFGVLPLITLPRREHS